MTGKCEFLLMFVLSISSVIIHYIHVPYIKETIAFERKTTIRKPIFLTGVAEFAQSDHVLTFNGQ